VRFLSLYSRSDEVVHWEACLDPAAEQLEVATSHVGMAVARSVWSALAAELAPESLATAA
jgi:triacylglycerol lipase